MRLRSYDQSPPGGYPYEQTGEKARKFGKVPLIEAQAHAVTAYRKANKLARATYAEALADIDRFQCTRLGDNPQWCVPTDSDETVSLAANAPGLAPCGTCGVVMQ